MPPGCREEEGRAVHRRSAPVMTILSGSPRHPALPLPPSPLAHNLSLPPHRPTLDHEDQRLGANDAQRRRYPPTHKHAPLHRRLLPGLEPNLLPSLDLRWHLSAHLADTPAFATCQLTLRVHYLAFSLRTRCRWDVHKGTCQQERVGGLIDPRRWQQRWYFRHTSQIDNF